MFTIRPFEESDWPTVWQIIEPVFRAGETYPKWPDINEPDAHHYWIEHPTATYVAFDGGGAMVGTYHIRPNQPGLGSHVCNCGYIVAEEASGRGVGAAMCEHSQREAVVLGFRAMQYNLVVATNTRAVELWKRMGMQVIGALPGAFKHSTLGYVDALVMYKTLVE